jgi:integrase
MGLSTNRDGTMRVTFVDRDHQRRTLWIDKVLTKKAARSIAGRVKELNAAAIAGCGWDRELAAWVAELGNDLAEKLARVGLIPPRAATLPLGAFLDKYIEDRKANWKEWTVINNRQAVRRLVEYFGAEKRLRDITTAEVELWLESLKSRYATATVSRTLKRARQFFSYALKQAAISQNPFAAFKPGSQANDARKVFVAAAKVQKVMEEAPDQEWRAIIALARFGGLRVPSELLPLTWGDVDWERSRLRVRSPKTARHEGHAERLIPLFPQLRDCLGTLFNIIENEKRRPPAQSEPIIATHRGTNLRSQFERIIRAAGETPWERLFQNLRASRATELAEHFPGHVVAAWMGHSVTISAKHYLQVRDADFARAAGITEYITPTSQNASQIRAEPNRTERPKSTEVIGADGTITPESRSCEMVPSLSMPLVGLEPTTH